MARLQIYSVDLRRVFPLRQNYFSSFARGKIYLRMIALRVTLGVYLAINNSSTIDSSSRETFPPPVISLQAGQPLLGNSFLFEFCPAINYVSASHLTGDSACLQESALQVVTRRAGYSEERVILKLRQNKLEQGCASL